MVCNIDGHNQRHERLVIHRQSFPKIADTAGFSSVNVLEHNANEIFVAASDVEHGGRTAPLCEDDDHLKGALVAALEFPRYHTIRPATRRP